MNRIGVLAFGIVAYLLFFGTFLYAIGFVGNLLVPKSIDTESGTTSQWGWLINLALLSLFAVPHSIMARPGFKKRWTTLIPPVLERSVYVLVSSLLLALLFFLWQPYREIVWDIHNEVARTIVMVLFWIGWATVLISTFLTNHFELFGLRQTFCYFRQQSCPPIRFRERLFYRYIRHPLMLGFLIAFWAAPQMTVGHLLFASVTGAYILVAIRLEERDLISAHGEAYADYQRRTGMLFPLPSVRGGGAPDQRLEPREETR